MAAEAADTQGRSLEDEFGLEAIRQHNALLSTEAFPPYEEDTKGLGIFVSSCMQDRSMIHVTNQQLER